MSGNSSNFMVLTQNVKDVLNRLNTPIWVFDIDQKSMHWASVAGLQFWHSESVEELRLRDFRSDMTPATLIRLKDYLRRFLNGESITEQWTLYPKGEPVSCIAQFSGIQMENSEIAMLVEAQPVVPVSNNNLRMVEALRHVPVGISLFNFSGELFLQNPHAMQTFGDARLSTRFVNVSDFSALIQILQAGQVFQSEVQMKTLAGNSWFSVEARPAADPVSGDSCILMHVVDIQENKVAQEELRQQHHLMHSILDAVPINIFLKDAEGRFVLFNRHASETTGKPKEQVLGLTDYDIFPSETAKRLRKVDWEVIRDQKMVHYEERLELLGEIKWMYAGKQPIHLSEDEPPFLLGFSVDITNRKRIEQELDNQRKFIRQVIDTDPNLIFVKDAFGRFLFVNQATANVFGKTVEEMERGSNSDVHHQKEAVQGYNATDQQVIEERCTITLEECFTFPNGDVHWYQTTKTPLVQPDGEIYVLCIAVDITRHKEDEVALIEAKEMADAANRAKSQFLANMSHEIRTPMNGVLGITELLAHSPLNSQQQRYVNALLTSGRHLLHLINDILDFSKLEAGKLELKFAPYDVEECLKEIVEMLGVQAQEKNLGLQYHVDSRLQFPIVGDARRLKQVLANLIGNAIKFTDQGHIDATTQLIHEETSSIKILFSVKDTGVGIPKSEQSSLFHEFSQLDGSVTRRYEGTGLGLAISKKLIGLMGGEISVESEEGKGSDFRFTIVAERAEAPQHSHSPLLNRENHSSLSVAQHFPLNILLAEDNPLNQMVTLGFLEALGYTAVVAHNGKQAIESLQQKHYDLIFMDYHMPEMDGVEATRHICENWPLERRPVIVAMTADAFSDDREKLLKLGMNEYLSKPINLEELRATIERSYKRLKARNLKPSATVHSSALAEPFPRKDLDQTSVELIDTSILKNYDPDLQTELLEIFFASSLEALCNIRTYAEAGKAAKMGEESHKLKGGCLAIGAVELAKQCTVLQACGENQDLSNVHDKIPALEHCYQKTQQALQVLFQELSTR